MRGRATGFRRGVAAVLLAAAMGTDCGIALAQGEGSKQMAAEARRGRYLAQIGGCNDCHTPGYPAAGGKVDEKLWLTGDSLGWRGPWGTTYPSNLRLVAQQLTEDQWVANARRQLRPPMPWFNLRDMADHDLRAIYRYLKHVGPAGVAAPAYVPPGEEPKPPYVQFPPPPK